MGNIFVFVVSTFVTNAAAYSGYGVYTYNATLLDGIGIVATTSFQNQLSLSKVC